MTAFTYMNAAEVLDRMFAVYKKTFWHNVGLNLLVRIVGGVGMFFVMILVMVPVVIIAAVTSALAVNWAAVVVAAVIGSAVLCWLYALYTGASVSGGAFLAEQAYKAEKPSLGLAMNKVFGSFGRLVTASAAQAIVVLPALAVGALVAYFVIINAAGTAVYTGGFISVVIICAVVFTAVALIIATALVLAVPVAVMEKRHFFGAVKRGFALVKPNFWNVFGIVLVWQLVLGVYTASLYLLFYLGLSAAGLFGELTSLDVYPTVMLSTTIYSYIFSAAIGLVTAPFSGILPYVIYYNQRAKAEGLDIVMNLQTMRANNGRV